MTIIEQAASLEAQLHTIRSAGKTIGFVPTMGALHPGHVSLINESKKQADYTVVSIFVNPTQFNNPEDFRLYPTQTQDDLNILKEANCDLVFLPPVNEIYPSGTQLNDAYDLGYLETIMEGKFRPGHFQGVCQVVDRLLSIVSPNILFLGQKDLQQCKVIEKMLTLTGRSKQIRLVICPTLRESDGLAMSSRNQRLSKSDRLKAAEIYKGFNQLKEKYGRISFLEARQDLVNSLKEKEIDVEYMELVDTHTLEIIDEWSTTRPLSVCIAAYIGNVRLIDNMILFAV